MEVGVQRLLADAGIALRTGPRSFRLSLGLPHFEVKILKPQSIVEMLHLGSRDVGFAGADWVAEHLEAVDRAALSDLIPTIRAHGGTDLVIFAPVQIVP